MSDTVITARAYSDIYRAARDLTRTDADRICIELERLHENGDERLVAWLPNWLAEEKDLTLCETTRRIALVQLERETENAFGVSQPGWETDELLFLPKSVARVFERGHVDALQTQQQGLGAFE